MYRGEYVVRPLCVCVCAAFFRLSLSFLVFGDEDKGKNITKETASYPRRKS